MRHKLALLVLLSGVLTVAACGDDNDTPVLQPTPTNTSLPPPPTTPPVTATQVPPTTTNTPGGDTPSPTVTPTPTATGGTPEVSAFSCDVRTSFTCQGGSRDGQICRPARSTPQPDDLCPGGECLETEFFCKGGDDNGQPCERPRNTRTPEPCTGGGRCQNSELQICTQSVCPIVSRRLGGARLDVECNTANGQCSATLDEFDPVDIPGIGFVCVRPIPDLVCPEGQLHCDGGSGLDYDLLQVHTIGSCGVPNDPSDNTGNPQCEEMCMEYCTRKGSTMIDFGCAGYCKAGGELNEKKDLYCRCDSATQQCTGPNCAPEGSCNGKDLRDTDVNNPNALRDRNVCGCQCLTEGGNPSRAGAINFRIGAQIIVETAPPCGSGAVLLTLAPQCIPLTSEISSGVLTNANNSTTCNDGDPGPGCAQIPAEGKLVRQGEPVSCAQLLSGDASGLNIVGNISFFDSTIGDIETLLDWNCR